MDAVGDTVLASDAMGGLVTLTNLPIETEYRKGDILGGL
jgi:hypothetical protein